MSRRHDDRPNIVRRALEARSALASDLVDPTYLGSVVHGYARTMVPSYAGADRDTQRSLVLDMARRWTLSLQVGEVYAVSHDMMAVVETAAMDLPDDYIAEHHHLHAEHGFLYLPRPLVEPQDSGNMLPDVDVMTWHHGTGWTRRQPDGSMGDYREAAGIEVNLWARTDHALPPHLRRDHALFPVGSDFLPYGLPSLGWRMHGVGRNGEEYGNVENRLSITSRFTLALQMLMRQELPSLERYTVPRAEVRALRRQRLPINPVTVVDLRRRARREHPDALDGTGGHLTHRHLVRGHWHGYWVGPTHAQHPGGAEDKVLIYNYVAPYVKGPEGTPLVVSDKVNVVRR